MYTISDWFYKWCLHTWWCPSGDFVQSVRSTQMFANFFGKKNVFRWCRGAFNCEQLWLRISSFEFGSSIRYCGVGLEIAFAKLRREAQSEDSRLDCAVINVSTCKYLRFVSMYSFDWGGKKFGPLSFGLLAFATFSLVTFSLGDEAPKMKEKLGETWENMSILSPCIKGSVDVTL